jgi:hypothetical protein
LKQGSAAEPAAAVDRRNVRLEIMVDPS